MSEHAHEPNLQSGSKGLLIALIITIVMMMAEVAGGFLSNSLALLGDAGHMFTDVFSLGLSLFAFNMARRPPNSTKTYGYHRMEVMAALTNGALLIIISIAIFYEAYRRFASPPEIKGPIMLIIASIGLIANLAGIYVLKDTHTDNLNIRSAFLHIVGDTLSSVGVILGGILIITEKWYFVDPIISILIGVIIIRGAISIIFESSSILLEYVPGNIDPDTVNKALMGIKGVKNVHDLHIWAITSGLYSMSSHIMIDDKMISEGALIIQQVEGVMKEKFHISHTTIQLECDNCECGMVCSMVSKNERK
jgi:cobalt-zinc-cadmium efflux system protein